MEEQFQSLGMMPDRPEEQEAVKTTIVGGRPPGSGRANGNIPRGMEVLVKKAAVDAEFRALLLEKRADAAAEIGLELEPQEQAMLRSVSSEHLEKIIEGTSVPDSQRRAFLGTVAAVMLAAIGAGCSSCMPAVTGVRPDEPAPAGIRPEAAPGTKGIRPDVVPVTDGIRPDNPAPSVPVSRGVRPDRPNRREVITLGIEPDNPRKQENSTSRSDS